VCRCRLRHTLEGVLYEHVISRVSDDWGLLPHLFRVALEMRESTVSSFGRGQLCFYLVRGIGNGKRRYHGDSSSSYVSLFVVFHCLNCNEFELCFTVCHTFKRPNLCIYFLYYMFSLCKQSLQRWFHCMPLLTCVSSVCVGVTTLMCLGRECAREVTCEHYTPNICRCIHTEVCRTHTVSGVGTEGLLDPGSVSDSGEYLRTTVPHYVGFNSY
jgi:hypothetical protein